MNNLPFFQPSKDHRIEAARLALLESGLDPNAFLDLAFGQEPALIMADAGVPVAPLHPSTFQFLAEPSTSADCVARAFANAPDALVGYNVTCAPFAVLMSTSSRAAFRLLIEAGKRSPPGMLCDHLTTIGMMPGAHIDDPAVRLFAAKTKLKGFVSFEPEGGEAVQFVAPMPVPRADRHRHQFIAVPAGLALGLATDPLLRQTMHQLYGRLS